jgi:hypothetical protein
MPTDKYTRFIEVRGGMTFIEVLWICLNAREFVVEWERVSGMSLFPKSPLDKMIDEATGYDKVVMSAFADFVYDYVFKLF